MKSLIIFFLVPGFIFASHDNSIRKSMINAVEKEKFGSLLALIIAYEDFDINFQDTDGDTLLMKAVKKKNLDIVTYLLTIKVDPNIANTNGITPLMIAAQNDNDKIVQVLLEHGADAARFDKKGKSTLDYAQGESKKLIMNYLKKLEAKYRETFQERYKKQGHNIPKAIENIMIDYSLPASTP